jgi:hypothetical protein
MKERQVKFPGPDHPKNCRCGDLVMNGTASKKRELFKRGRKPSTYRRIVTGNVNGKSVAQTDKHKQAYERPSHVWRQVWRVSTGLAFRCLRSGSSPRCSRILTSGGHAALREDGRQSGSNLDPATTKIVSTSRLAEVISALDINSGWITGKPEVMRSPVSHAKQ